MSEYRISRARTAADVEAMKALERRSFPGDYPPNWARSESQWWVVKLDGNVVGFGGGWLYAAENMYFLERSGIASEHQGHGLQKRLIRVRIAAARAAGARGVFTYTRDNPASANSLISCGLKMYTPAWRYGGKASQYWRLLFNKGIK